MPIVYTWGLDQWGQFPWGGGILGDQGNLEDSFEFDHIVGELFLQFSKFEDFTTNNFFDLVDRDNNNLLINASGVNIKSEKAIVPSEIISSIPTFTIWNKIEPLFTPKRWLENLDNQTLVNIAAEAGWEKNLFEKIFRLVLRLKKPDLTKLEDIILATVIPDELTTFSFHENAELKCKSIISLFKKHSAEKARPDPSNWYQNETVGTMIRILIQRDNGVELDGTIKNKPVISATNFDSGGGIFKGTLTDTGAFTGKTYNNDSLGTKSRVIVKDNQNNIQIRSIESNTNDVLTLDTQWKQIPDTTFEYTIETSNGFAGIFSNTDVDTFFNTNLIDTSGVIVGGNRILSSVDSIKNLTGNPQFGNACVFNNNRNDTNELYIGTENKLFFVNPFNKNDIREIGNSGLASSFFIFRLFITRQTISGNPKDLLYGIAIKKGNPGDNSTFNSPSVDMRFFQYIITDNYEVLGNPSQANGRPKGTAAVTLHGTTITGVYAGEILEAFKSTGIEANNVELMIGNAVASINGGTGDKANSNIIFFNDQVISANFNLTGTNHGTSGSEFFQPPSWTTFINPFVGKDFVANLQTTDAAGTFKGTPEDGNKQFWAHMKDVFRGISGTCSISLTYNSASIGFMIFDDTNGKIIYYKYTPSTETSDVKSITLNHGTFLSSTVDNAEFSINGQITCGMIDASGDIYSGVFIQPLRKVIDDGTPTKIEQKAQTAIFKNSSAIYNRTDKLPATTATPAYDDLHRVPIITEIIDDTKTTDQIILMARGTKINYDPITNVPEKTGQKVFHIATIKKDGSTGNVAFANEFIELDSLGYQGMIQSGAGDSNKVFMIKNTEGKLYL